MGKLKREQIAEIQKLYKAGKGLSELGRQFNCHHTSIMYQVGRTNKKKIPRNEGIEEPKPGWPKGANKLSREPFRKTGSMYADYLAKELIRQKKQDLLISVLFASKIKK